MKRRKTRELVLKALFAFEIEKSNPFFHLDYIAHDPEMAGLDGGQIEEFLSKIEDDFARKLTEGIISRCKEIDAAIGRYMVDWDLKRLGGAERNIMRLAAYEMLIDKLPPAIAINEAVDLAKKYGSEESSRFINGILGKLAEDIAGPAEESGQPEQ